MLWIIFQLMPAVDHARLEQELKEDAQTFATGSTQAILKSPQAQQVLAQSLPDNMVPEILRQLVLLTLAPTPPQNQNKHQTQGQSQNFAPTSLDPPAKSSPAPMDIPLPPHRKTLR